MAGQREQAPQRFSDSALEEIVRGKYVGLVKALARCLLAERRQRASGPVADRKRELESSGKTTGLPVRDPRDIEIERLRAEQERLLDELRATMNKRSLYAPSKKNTGHGPCPKCHKRNVFKLGNAHGCCECQHQWSLPDETKLAQPEVAAAKQVERPQANTNETKEQEASEARANPPTAEISVPW